jgi:hypothetical protein
MERKVEEQSKTKKQFNTKTNNKEKIKKLPTNKDTRVKTTSNLLLTHTQGYN